MTSLYLITFCSLSSHSVWLNSVKLHYCMIWKWICVWWWLQLLFLQVKLSSRLNSRRCLRRCLVTAQSCIPRQDISCDTSRDPPRHRGQVVVDSDLRGGQKSLQSLNKITMFKRVQQKLLFSTRLRPVANSSAPAQLQDPKHRIGQRSHCRLRPVSICCTPVTYA